MIQHQGRLYENKTQAAANINRGNTAVQLKDNREHSVVRRKLARLKPTVQMKVKVNINDDKDLENEADVMGNKTFQLVDNRPEAIQMRKFQEKLNNNPPVKQQTIQKKDKVIQLLSEEDEENKRRFWQICNYRNGLKEGIEFLFETYHIGSLDNFDLVIDDGDERFHGMTELGFNYQGEYSGKPKMTISSKYVWRMYDDSFERILRTLIHEMKHVKDRNDRAFIMNRPSGHEMEFRAYYDEIFNNSGAMPEHSLKNKKIRAQRALDHLDQSGDRQAIYGLDERQDLVSMIK